MMAKALMVQGTMSGVGKSLLVAGLCRMLAQDGMHVAPFKAQNMALNSAITRDGCEMGRAQVVQAQAAGVEPSVHMNPVLLKPTTDTGSQVIVRGRPRATMSAREYFAYRSALTKEVMASYRELASEFDVILIEGAGSPVELNLGPDDFVNMGMAHLAQAPVALVGDIDKGGVFAQLIGTMDLLASEERAMVRASVVNKFRGDASLFDDGVRILRERMGVPVLGVVPYLPVDIDDEDSVSGRLAVRHAGALVDVAVLRLPKVSNFTDLIPLEATEGVGVRYVSEASELGMPDLVVLPGTKATLADLRWLRGRGLDVAIARAARAGVPVLGICGGYQMLGETIEDPDDIECGGVERGLGLLPVRTVFRREKHTTRTTGAFCAVGGLLAPLSGQVVEGYEIHQGETQLAGGAPLLEVELPDGTVSRDGCQRGSVYGTYLHGLFDSEGVGAALVSALLAAKGMDATSVQGVDMAAYRERNYDLLAEGLRASIDQELLYRIIEEGL